MEERLLFRIADAAERLSISRAYLYEQIAAGRINVVRIGGAVRVPAAELERFVRELQSAAGKTQ